MVKGGLGELSVTLDEETNLQCKPAVVSNAQRADQESARGPGAISWGFAHILTCASGPFIPGTSTPKVCSPPGAKACSPKRFCRDCTDGYRHHPQLIRFRAHKDPVEAIAAYLRFVYNEALARGYNFDVTKIAGRQTASRPALHSRPTAPRVETFAGEAES